MNKIMEIVTHGFRAEGTIITLGNFDGVHLGHQLLIEKLLSKPHLLPIVFTFDTHSFSVLKHTFMPLLTTNSEKLSLLASFGIPYVYMAHATPEFMKTSAEDFVKQYLVDALGASHVVVGNDCRFGKEGKGTPALLEELGKRYHFEVTCISKLLANGDEISSTRIRQHLRTGAVDKAAALLGRNYTISGDVVPGRHVGTSLGMPTINLSLPQDKLIPEQGVYATTTYIDDSAHPSVSFIGTSPTYQTNTPLLETHILDIHENLYGKHVTIAFRRFLRPAIQFTSVQALTEQLKKDILCAQEDI